ncbi:HET-domain-containing protein [Lojkania enalia]|uniref:HET-domain-containing protein n=1 Tax=Lojkania enalia TaxID=147567 RepID=A0A9P4K429_9PLEO|nr:HET-domain-containing protein [Didymosphaeria enalia]
MRWPVKMRRSKKSGERSVFKPLPACDSIRILKLFPGNFTDPLECKTVIVPSMGRHERYEAVSYVWGDLNDAVDITCNGLPFTISANLADALRVFRNPAKARKLWVDIICINQQDKEEKSYQVRRMHEVYQNAVRVLAWVGHDQDGIAEDSFRLIRETNEYFDDFFEDYGPRLFHMLTPVPPHPICTDRDRWEKVAALLRRPWFGRVWAVQEAGIAKDCDLYWGASKICVAHLVELACWIFRKWELSLLLQDQLYTSVNSGMLVDVFRDIQASYTNKSTWRTSLPLIKWEQKMHSQVLFVDILDAARALSAADPRDHVYAYLGSPSARLENGQLIVDVDYEKSVDEVYFDTARALLGSPREAPWFLSLIENHYLEDILNRETPSWVPRWHEGLSGRRRIAYSTLLYGSGGATTRSSKTVRENRLLEAAGFVFDEIIWLSEPMEEAKFSVEPRILHDSVHTAGEPFIETLWKSVLEAAPLDHDDFLLTFVWGYPRNEVIDNALMEQLRENFVAYKQRAWLALTSSDTQNPNDQTSEGNWMDFHSRLGYCHNYCLLRTKSGRIGLAPRDITEINDVCCVVLGDSVPYILKPVAGTTRYKLVGESYIHGVMRGELLEQVDGGRLKETITLE